MTARQELIEALAAADAERSLCARRAEIIAQRCEDLREENPLDPRIVELSIHIDALDERYDQLSDQIGRLKSEIFNLDAQHAARCRASGLNYSEW